MDLNFITDPNQAPVPRDEVRIDKVELEPFPDGRRLRVMLTITPFMPADRPNIAIHVTDSQDTEVASTTVIETVQNAIALTLHLRGTPADDTYTITTNLYYEDNTIQDSTTTPITINRTRG